MVVIGVLEGTGTEDQCVVMTCKDKRVYVFDGELMHAAVDSLACTFSTGLKFPSDETYYNGEFYDVTTDEQWDAMERGSAMTPEALREFKESLEILKKMAEMREKGIELCGGDHHTCPFRN
ncbi:US22 family protein [Cod iridovirus]|uniref:US22 family protein n=2 Tax=Frog virus 3 TaxID=10493 RepID=A0A1B2IU74_FRG3V|nr:hypothetical protein BGV90_gp027 [Ranavirus maximus]ANZ57054.1 US22 family protein [Cod iridovirus]ANZ57152.1 US22 family protein [Ranavirus maximus]